MSKQSESDKDKKNMNKQKQNKPVSNYHERLGNFYNFSISEQKLSTLEGISKKKAHRYFFTGIIFGFFTQYLLGNTKIYDNAVDRATMRRLNAKLKEDSKIGQIKQRKNRENQKTAN